MTAMPVRLLERTFCVAAPPERAWTALADVASWPTWARHIRSVELEPPGPLSADSAGRIRLVNGIRSTFRVALFDRGRRWRWVGPFLWLRVDYDHLFQPSADGGTEITFVVSGSGVGTRTLGRLFARVYARDLDRAIPRLVALLADRGAV